MSGRVPARSVAGWCVLALLFCATSAAAMPVPDRDMAQTATDIAPDVSNLRIPEIVASPSAAPEPFGLHTTQVLAGPLWNKWQGVVAQIRAESEILAGCIAAGATCPKAAARFLAIVANGRMRSGLARLGEINRAVNLSIRPMSDLAQYGVEDRWTSPLATLTAGAGDCEDYAIAKYVALQATGIDENDVRLVIVRDTAAREDHAVVAARLDGRWVMLDNRHLMMVADTEMRSVIPLFVLDHDGVKRYAPAIGPVASARHPVPPANGAAPAIASAGM
jgi:predicted transglutaminase-like cysteine proteinase